MPGLVVILGFFLRQSGSQNERTPELYRIYAHGQNSGIQILDTAESKDALKDWESRILTEELKQGTVLCYGIALDEGSVELRFAEDEFFLLFRNGKHLRKEKIERIFPERKLVEKAGELASFYF